MSAKKGEYKNMKKVLSLFLSLVMIFSVSVCAFAADEKGAKTADSDPVIMVRGMDFMNVKLDPNTKDERAINDFSVKTIAPAVFKTLFQLLLKRDKDGAIDTVLDCAYDILKFNTMDENGDPAYNSGMRDYSLSADRYPELLEGKDCELGMVRTWLETYGKKYVYYVSYDWRVDPFVVAEQINSTVTLALKNTGRKKVNIVAASMGGIMTMAYLSKYGYEKVSRADTRLGLCFIRCAVSDDSHYVKSVHDIVYCHGICINDRNIMSLGGNISDKCIADLAVTGNNNFHVIKSAPR